MKKSDLELLYHSFDADLSREEKKRLELALKQSKELQEEKKRIFELRESVSSSGQDSFKPHFTEGVMRKIEKMRRKKSPEEQFFRALISEFRPVFVTALLLVAALVSFNLIRSNRVSLASAFAEPEISLEEAYEPTFAMNMESKP